MSTTKDLDGGADEAQQYRKDRLIDEIEIHVVPMLLGDGTRLFDNMDGRQAAYECVRVINSLSITHYTYRLRQQAGGSH